MNSNSPGWPTRSRNNAAYPMSRRSPSRIASRCCSNERARSARIGAVRRLLRQAKLRLPSATIEDLNFRAKRGLDRSVVLRLTGCDWIHQHQVTLITGATGTGKTFLACALGQAACRHGLSVRYFRLSRLLDELRIARADGSYTRLLDRLQRTAALLIDDFGLQALSETERRDLLEVLEDRYGQRATARCQPASHRSLA